MTALRHILVLYAHPNPTQSRAQKALHAAIQDLEGVEVHDLYRLYPHSYIDVEKEQAALLRSDLIVFQHPIYWYSCPALLKEWQDLVLLPGFAYGPGGVALRGKDFLQVVSSGGPQEVYQRGGANRFTLLELLRPFETTAHLCGLHYHRPLTVQGVNRLTPQQLEMYGQQYRFLLQSYLEQGREALQPLNTAVEGYEHG